MITIRPEQPKDLEGIRRVITAAFHQTAEVILVDQLRDEGDLVVSLVAEENGAVVGHIAFSRMKIVNGKSEFPAVALAPLAVLPERQGEGIGARLVTTAHEVLRKSGEKLSIVLGDPDFYGRFGYSRELAEDFDTDYQSDDLMALGLDGEVPRTGELHYALAFAEL
jgi:putative acetyltransferase